MNRQGPIPVLIVLPNLGGGGAERAVVTLLTHLDRAAFQPHLALFRRTGSLLEALPDRTTVHEIGPAEDHGWVRRTSARLRGLTRIVRNIRPALVMSVLWQTNITVLTARTLGRWRAPLVINEQVAPRENLACERGGWLFWHAARRLYPLAAAIVTTSQGVRDELMETIRLDPGRSRTLPNPIDLAEIRKRSDRTQPRPGPPVLISAGRLVPQKDFPLLIHAMARVTREVPARLLILGEGPDRRALEQLIRQLGLNEQVALPGFDPNPYPAIAAANLFVLSSRWEGFGNVLVEAMALGIPVIATDCPHGPREILCDGQHGLLVPVGDPEALAAAILRLLREPKAREALAASGKARAEAFDASRVVPQYESLFREVIGQQADGIV